MAEKAITINTAPEAEAHIFAQDDAAIFHSILGGASGILPGESLMPATKISNNLVRIGPGVFSNQGYMVRIATGDYKDLTIDSGTAGMNRYDLIVAEFTRVGAVDSHILKVVKGTATSGTPADPTLTQQNLDQSGTVRQEPLYRVRLSGTTLTQIDLLATQLPNLNLVQLKYICKMYQSANQLIPTGVVTHVNFNATEIDTAEMASPANGRIYCKKSGVYVVSGRISFAQYNEGSRAVYIVKNGTVLTGAGGVNAVGYLSYWRGIVPFTIVLTLAEGDYISISCWQNTVVAINAEGGADRSEFVMYCIS